LAPETVAVYLQSATKVFGLWAADTADNWDDDELPRVKAVVESVISGVSEFVSSPDIEVQERVRSPIHTHFQYFVTRATLQAANAHQLFAFVRADLASYRARPQEGFGAPEPGSSADGATSDGPRFPKSLMLIGPLFSSYELNPVATEAQASVPVPEGLDLDTWFVPPPPEEEADVVGEDDADVGPKAKKVKKGKGKGKEREGASGKPGKKKRRPESQGDNLTPEPETLTPEERAEMERVRPAS
jgi:AP-3 complex subunit delta